MKNTILLFATALFYNLSFSQFSPTGTSLINNRFREGTIGVGYTAPYPTAAVIAADKFMVNGDSYFSGNIGLRTTTPLSKLDIPSGNISLGIGQIKIGNQFNAFYTPNSRYAIMSTRSIIVDATSDTDPDKVGGFEVAYSDNNVGKRIIMTMSKCVGCGSKNAKPGDAILRGLTNGSLIITNDFTGDIKFETNETFSPYMPKVQMRIDKFGNIGIGTGSADLVANEKLAVNGLIHTKEVKVDLVGWPDYVFAKEYKLPSLQEVEKQIVTNGHLANIPSATEVEKNGVLLGDINKKLLQKVEELTLYLISQNKEIENLKVLVKSLVEKNK